MAKPDTADCFVDNLVIGSGLAALAAAKALYDRRASFQVIDAGRDLEPERTEVARSLSRQPPALWPHTQTEWLFPSPVASRQGVERRRAFGSDFPYAWPPHFSAQLEGCATEFSFARGGLANVWGGALLPYTVDALRNWPIDNRDLAQSYRNVLAYVPISGEVDELESKFPLYSKTVGSIARSRQADTLLRVLESKRGDLSRDGISFGRARVAVEARSDRSGCQYCGYCLDGCVYGALFSPRQLWPDLERRGVSINSGWFVQALEEQDDHVSVTAVRSNGASRRWRSRRVFVGAGHFGTTAILARSLGLFETPIRILDSQYFHFPLFSYRPITDEPRFTLAEAFLEVLDPRISEEHIHFQVYGWNRIFEQALRAMLPSFVSPAQLLSRLYLFQGYLPSDLSGHLELVIHRTPDARDQITVKGVANSVALRVAKRVKRRIVRHLSSLGLAPPIAPSLVPPGRSFHSGGSFPMGGPDPVFSSDGLGRPMGFDRVHIVDAANFPTIASSTIGLTIMANADRIARATAQL